MKEMKDLYPENYKTVERKKIPINGNNIPSSWKGRINTVKMAILPEAIYQFNAIPIKMPIAFFNELDHIVLKFIWYHGRPQIAKAIMRRKNKAGGGLCSLTSSSTAKTIWYWRKNRPIGQWNTLGIPDINPSIYGQLLYDKGAMDIQWGNNSIFNNWCWKTGQLHARE